MKLAQVIEELVEEKGLDRDAVADIVCEGLLSAYVKKYPTASLSVVYNKKADELTIFAKKTVVSNVVDDAAEITVRKAHTTHPKAKAGDVIEVPFEEPIGRIEILKAKQLIAQKIRSLESSQVYDAFKDKVGTIIHGVVHKVEMAGVTIKIDDVLAFLPKSLAIPGENFVAGHTIKALLKEVLPEPRNENQLILDRASTDFVQKLFELEIPEIYEKILEIKKIVRIPGYKTKILIASNDKNIDPVGTCIGVGGGRIKPVLKELGAEKIDVIKYSEFLDELVRGALKPAVVDRIKLVDDLNVNVWVDEDQRSIAIGRSGQNIALASRLLGLSVNLVKGDVAGMQEKTIGEMMHESEQVGEEKLNNKSAQDEVEKNSKDSE